MPNIEALLKEEISKIVRKEVQDQMRGLKKTVSEQSTALARLEKKIGPAKTKAKAKTKATTRLTAVPAGQGDGDRAFVVSVIKDSLKHMTRAVRVIKDTRTSGGKSHALKGDAPDKVQGILDKVANVVQDQSSFLRQELDHYQNGLEWDKLCVVMYGPTNSGKSTIIEALSCGDGQTIGTGEKDYTLKSREIQFGPFLLVDTPGIEGGEGELRLDTQAAVRKAHVVLVVTGTGKEPEKGVLDKVADDAERTGEILSILNVRRLPTAYKRRPSLGTRDTPNVEKRIRLSMAQVFADRYTAHLNLNAYLAFVAAHRESGIPSEQYQRDRERTAEIFGSIDKAATFSGIGQLVSKLDELTREAQPRILWGNGFKAITVLGDVSSNFSKASSSLDDAAKLWNKAIRDAKAKSSLAIKRSRARAGQTISSRLSRLSNELKATFQDGVDSGLSSSTLKRKFRSAIKSAEPDLRDIINEELNALREDLKVEMNRLHERMNVRLFVADFDLPDMDKILRDASLSVGREAVGVLGSILSTVLAALINPILGIITGIVAVLRKIWEWFGGGKRKRERKARTEAGCLIDREMTKVRKKLRDKLDEGWDKLEAQVLLHLDDAERLASAFQGASDSLKEEAITLDIAATRLTTRFLQTDDSTPERDLLIPVQGSESDGIDLLVHVGKGPWKLPRLSTLPKLCSYPNASAVRRAGSMTREQRERAYIVAKRMRHSEQEGRTYG